ncbi:MAG TPA: LptA/OstA family protein [Bacillota bacterium]|nr:LptA/OstA family protein [Bacillota bacterium]
MKNGFLVIILGLFLGLGGIAAAADEPVKATGTYIYGDTEKKISHIDGNVRITQGSTVITTDKATIYMDKKQVVLEGKVVLVNPDGTVTADYLDYDLRKKTGQFKGNVVMQRKAVKDSKAKKNTKDPFTLWAEELYLESDQKNFIATRAKFDHKEFKGTANQVTYTDSSEEMLFNSDVHLKKGKGEEIRSEEIKVNLKDKSFAATNNVSIQMEVDDEEEDKTPPKKPGSKK